jgi:outer membrane protein assembly factor BamC
MSPHLSLTPTRVAVLALCFGILQGCSSYSDLDSKVNYKSQSTVKTTPLDVPPDLTQLGRDTKYNIPGGAVSANSLNNKPAATQNVVAPKQINDVRIERDGARRWLVVNRPAEAVWPVVDDFWKENGFTYVLEKQDLGLLETEWAENRAKIPMDFIRRTIGKVVDNLYSSGTRDKFRTRIERNEQGGVDIFITHRGMSEEYADATKIRTIWMPRPADPELEAEFLARLMVKLGVTNETARSAVDQTTALSTSASATQSNPNLLTLKDSFDVAWRRVGLALDRTGFTVEDRDRAQGIYFVRYVETANKEEPGFFKKLFSASKPDTGPQKFRVVVLNTNGVSQVSIQNSEGKPDQGEIAQRILKLLSDNLS